MLYISAIFFSIFFHQSPSCLMTSTMKIWQVKIKSKNVLHLSGKKKNKKPSPPKKTQTSKQTNKQQQKTPNWSKLLFLCNFPFLRQKNGFDKKLGGNRRAEDLLLSFFTVLYVNCEEHIWWLSCYTIYFFFLKTARLLNFFFFLFSTAVVVFLALLTFKSLFPYGTIYKTLN